MPERFSNSAVVRFLDLGKVLEELRRAASEARAAHPEILQVFLFGSLVRGDWTADSDADLIVVVRREFFANLLERSRYQIYTPAIQTDTLVYSEAEFELLACDPGSFLAQALSSAMVL